MFDRFSIVGVTLGHFGGTLGTLWGHFGVTLGLLGPKSENVTISSASVRPKWAYKQQIHISATNCACPRQKREPREQRSDRGEKRSPKEVLSEPLRRRKSEFVRSNCFVSIFRIVLHA